jgi:hypothetical protein
MKNRVKTIIDIYDKHLNLYNFFNFLKKLRK